jgi:ABC-type transporter Mla MlaB component
MGARARSAAVLAVDGALARADLPGLCARMRALLEATGAELVVCDVGALVGADAVAIDALARLQLTARRLGSRICVRRASPELRDLLAFTGLADLCGLRLELERQAEERKDPLRVEEERELDDPPA